MPAQKYRHFPPIALPDRRWPGTRLTKAPIWCSVDLRDGNQALIEPMGRERKRRFLELLLKIGFKEIEVGFPSASETEWDFARAAIEGGWIPDGVTIQVLTQSRPELIARSFEAIAGSQRAVVHLYNSTSELQRRVVFRLDRAGIIDIARRGTTQIRELAEKCETEVQLEYSPESFTGTELDFAVEICEAVMEIWEPNPSRKLIVNLPATVEMATANVYADQVEWFARHVRDRDSLILSVHPHNDRGTAVAAAEFALMAGADRVEGTLFGNGERTGNVDIVTLALNLYTQGIDPQLAFWNIDDVVRIVEECNRLPVHPRHPYAGELVYTAFSGSHQDAIHKGLKALEEAKSDHWEVPYLPIDPADLGRNYQAVIRINSQSGKGGVAHVLETERDLRLPRGLQIEFSRVVQKMADESGGEVVSLAIWDAFRREYLERETPLSVLGFRGASEAGDAASSFSFHVRWRGREHWIDGRGTGPIDALCAALAPEVGRALRVLDYQEHAVGEGADAEAIAYLELASGTGAGAKSCFGVGRHGNITLASLRALASAVNRLLGES
jgi:2-isopropylmalate synthase